MKSSFDTNGDLLIRVERGVDACYEEMAKRFVRYRLQEGRGDRPGDDPRNAEFAKGLHEDPVALGRLWGSQVKRAEDEGRNEHYPWYSLNKMRRSGEHQPGDFVTPMERTKKGYKDFQGGHYIGSIGSSKRPTHIVMGVDNKFHAIDAGGSSREGLVNHSALDREREAKTAKLNRAAGGSDMMEWSPVEINGGRYGNLSSKDLSGQFHLSSEQNYGDESKGKHFLHLVHTPSGKIVHQIPMSTNAEQHNAVQTLRGLAQHVSNEFSKRGYEANAIGQSIPEPETGTPYKSTNFDDPERWKHTGIDLEDVGYETGHEPHEQDPEEKVGEGERWVHPAKDYLFNMKPEDRPHQYSLEPQDTRKGSARKFYVMHQGAAVGVINQHKGQTWFDQMPPNKPPPGGLFGATAQPQPETPIRPLTATGKYRTEVDAMNAGIKSAKALTPPYKPKPISTSGMKGDTNRERDAMMDEVIAAHQAGQTGHGHVAEGVMEEGRATPYTLAKHNEVKSGLATAGMDVDTMEPLSSGGTSSSYSVNLHNGTKAVYKPEWGENSLRAGIKQGEMHRREAAASDIADMLGMHHLVPPTITKKHEEEQGHEGSLQQFKPGRTAALVPESDRYGKSNNDLAKAGTFDYLIGNTDRHHSNWMLHRGKLVLIDHGHTLPSGDVTNGEVPDEVMASRAAPMNMILQHQAASRGLAIPEEFHALKWEDMEPVLDKNKIDQKAKDLAKLRLANIHASKGVFELPFQYHKGKEDLGEPPPLGDDEDAYGTTDRLVHDSDFPAGPVRSEDLPSAFKGGSS